MGGIKLKLQDGWSTNDPYRSLCTLKTAHDIV